MEREILKCMQTHLYSEVLRASGEPFRHARASGRSEATLRGRAKDDGAWVTSARHYARRMDESKITNMTISLSAQKR